MVKDIVNILCIFAKLSIFHLDKDIDSDYGIWQPKGAEECLV